MPDPFVAVTVAEAFMQFSQATVSALRAYEQGTRARLVEAESELRALRHERDDALRDLNAYKEQTRTCAAEVDRWKAETDRALLVNKHQAELVVQLRQEAQQWKDQCLRLEETLRGEIKAWKDQFLRVDAEHTRLLNQQLSSTISSQRAQTTLTAHTPKRVPLLAADSSATSSATKRGASASSSAAVAAAAAGRADKDRPSPTKTHAFPRIVRRVQAVVEVPIKEEEEEDGEGNLEPGISRPDLEPGTHYSVPIPTTAPIGNGGAGGSDGGRVEARRRKSSASSHRRRSLIASSDDGSYGYVDGEEPQSDESDDDDDGGGEYVDEEEVENAITANGGTGGTHATRTRTTGGGRKTVPWGRKHIRPEPDDEDDELMMYAKDNPHKVRPPHDIQSQRLLLRKGVTDATAQRLSATNASAQKRRSTETGSAVGVARVKRRR